MWAWEIFKEYKPEINKQFIYAIEKEESISILDPDYLNKDPSKIKIHTLSCAESGDQLRKQKLAYNVYKISMWLISLKILHRFKHEDNYSVRIYYDTNYNKICIHDIIIHDTDSWREKKDIISEHLACIWYYEKIERERRLTLDEITQQSEWLSSIFKRKRQ